MFTYPITFNTSADTEAALTMTRQGSFDGTNDFATGLFSRTDSSGQFMFWDYRDTHTAVKRIFTLHKATHDGDHQAYLNCRATAAPDAYDLEFRVRISGSDRFWKRWSTTHDAGTERHVIIRQTGSDIVCYEDGTLLSVSTSLSAIAPSDWWAELQAQGVDTLTIGATSSGGAAFDGAIHNFAYADTSLDYSTLHIGGEPRDLNNHPNLSRIKGWWLFNDVDTLDSVVDDTPANTVHDHISTADLTLTNGATFRDRP